MHKCNGRNDTLVLKVLVVLGHTISKHQPLVDNGPRRAGNRIVSRDSILMLRTQLVRSHFARHKQLALKGVIIGDVVTSSDEDLAVNGLCRLDAFAQDRRIDRHIAPPQNLEAFLLRGRLIGLLNSGMQARVTRHEQLRHAIVIGFRQCEAELLNFSRKEFMRQLNQNTGAVPRFGVGTHRATMFQIAKNFETVFDDFTTAFITDRTDHSDAAGIMLVCRVV